MVSKARIEESDFGGQSEFEHSKLLTAAHKQMLEDDDFGEGEVEDTQMINTEGRLAASHLKTPMQQKNSSLAINQQQSR